MIEINFLSSKTRHKQKQKEKDKKLFKIALIVLSSVCFLLLATVSLKLFLNLRIRNQLTNISQLKQTIINQDQVELSYLVFVNKLNSVGEIYALRSDKQTAMNYFADLMSEVATIVGMNYNEESGGLILRLNHDNVFSLERSMDIINSDLVKNVYKNVEKNTLRRQNQGNYELSLQIQLKTIEDLGLLNRPGSNDDFDSLDINFDNNSIQENFN